VVYSPPAGDGKPPKKQALGLRKHGAKGRAVMVDRQQIEALLSNRFPGTTHEQIAAAANAIMAMVTAAGKPTAGVGVSRKSGGNGTALPLPSRLK
jgi:hypothetical protein